ncbi:MAG: DedA family protein [Dehalococcoidia bacterium]
MLTVDAVRELIVLYGYLLLFPLAVVEGPIVTILAAFLASQGYLNVVIVFAVVVVADLFGDVLYYLVGNLANARLLNRWGARFGAGPRQLEAVSRHFDQHGGKTLLVAKLTHSVGFAVLIAAGASSMPMRTFLQYNLAGTLVKSAVLVAIGYLFGRYYMQVDSYIGRFSLASFVLIMVVGLVWALRRWLRE